MALPLLGSLRDLLNARLDGAAERAATILATALLAAAAAGLLLAAGLVALSHAIGFPAAALVFAAAFVMAALTVHLLGRTRSARRSAQVTAARNRATADIAVAASLAGSARPLLPIAVFLSAFVLARRR